MTTAISPGRIPITSPPSFQLSPSGHQIETDASTRHGQTLQVGAFPGSQSEHLEPMQRFAALNALSWREKGGVAAAIDTRSAHPAHHHPSRQ